LFVVFHVASNPLLQSIQIHYQFMQKVKEHELMRRMKRKLMLDWSVLSASIIGHYKSPNVFLHHRGYKKAKNKVKLAIVYLCNTLHACIISKKAAMFNMYKRTEQYSW